MDLILTLSTKLSPNAIIAPFRILVAKLTVRYKLCIVYNEVIMRLVTLGMWHVWVRNGGVQDLAGETGGKETAGETQAQMVDNIRMDLQEVGCGYMDWIGLAQDRES